MLSHRCLFLPIQTAVSGVNCHYFYSPPYTHENDSSLSSFPGSFLLLQSFLFCRDIWGAFLNHCSGCVTPFLPNISLGSTPRSVTSTSDVVAKCCSLLLWCSDKHHGQKQTGEEKVKSHLTEYSSTPRENQGRKARQELKQKAEEHRLQPAQFAFFIQPQATQPWNGTIHSGSDPLTSISNKESAPYRWAQRLISWMQFLHWDLSSQVCSGLCQDDEN